MMFKNAINDSAIQKIIHKQIIMFHQGLLFARKLNVKVVLEVILIQLCLASQVGELACVYVAGFKAKSVISWKFKPSIIS